MTDQYIMFITGGFGITISTIWTYLILTRKYNGLA